ncbi:hypothetical protein BDZ45DRAFT_292023 [Acephala macrosclerotiorum]|nr:hypothetical protein BDZ45DRAFT_292023 [Acephala macrosclerotiorum]
MVRFIPVHHYLTHSSSITIRCSSCQPNSYPECKPKARECTVHRSMYRYARWLCNLFSFSCAQYLHHQLKYFYTDFLLSSPVVPKSSQVRHWRLRDLNEQQMQFFRTICIIVPSPVFPLLIFSAFEFSQCYC